MAQPIFFDAIQNLKGIQMLTPSLGFRVINARGFSNTTNVRFVQMVDGADIQAPHIGAPIGNTLGPNDLDILKVEIIPGASAAIYGMNAINGIANFITKNAFDYQGIGINYKTVVNNFNSNDANLSGLNELNFRIAKAFNTKWAFKINATYQKGTDWTANNKTDLNTNANLSTPLKDSYNPGSDLVNIYGDEQGNRKTLTLDSNQYVISRTGYPENELTDYTIKNFKTDFSVYYKPNSKATISYNYIYSDQNNIYQRTNRFRFDAYITQQQLFDFSSNSFQFKAYLTTENTGNSYNLRSMAENIDRSFKTDNVWFADFTKQFNNSIAQNTTINEALINARNYADNGRLQPNTEAFYQKKSN